jgi:hypothetical protein
MLIPLNLEMALVIHPQIIIHLMIKLFFFSLSLSLFQNNQIFIIFQTLLMWHIDQVICGLPCVHLVV